MSDSLRSGLTYRRDAPFSYFKDLWIAGDGELRRRYPDAERRLVRYTEELDRVAADQNSRECRSYRQAGFELRAPNRTQGTGGFFTVPLWLIEAFATYPRPGRVLSSLMPQFPLPAGYSSVNVPRVATGTTTQPQSDNAAASETDITDTASQKTVATITGMSDWPLQALDQSPAGAHLDWVMYKDLSESYDAQLAAQLINGTGTGNQLLGLINVSGITTITFTAGTPQFSFTAGSSSNLYPNMGFAAAKIGDTRKLPPEAVLMTTSRWMWIATSTDNQFRPIVPPDLAPPRHPGTDGDPDGTIRPVSSVAGWPVYVDDAMPVTLGAGGNQDVVIYCRPSDMLLLESEPMLQTSRETLSGTLGVRFRLHRYVDAIVDRFPSGIAIVVGTGMVVQGGY